MERRAVDPVLDFLVVNHDTRLGQKACEAVGDAEFDRGVAAVIRTAGTPQIQRGTIGLELPHMLDYAWDWNPAPTSRPYQRVVHVHVNNHDFKIIGGWNERANSATAEAVFIHRVDQLPRTLSETRPGDKSAICHPAMIPSVDRHYFFGPVDASGRFSAEA
jgi:hypothetical protein